MRFLSASSLLQLEKGFSYSILSLETPSLLVMVRCGGRGFELCCPGTRLTREGHPTDKRQPSLRISRSFHWLHADVCLRLLLMRANRGHHLDVLPSTRLRGIVLGVRRINHPLVIPELPQGGLSAARWRAMQRAGVHMLWLWLWLSIWTKEGERVLW